MSTDPGAPRCTTQPPCLACHYCQLAAEGPDYWARRPEPGVAEVWTARQLAVAVIWQVAWNERAKL